MNIVSSYWASRTLFSHLLSSDEKEEFAKLLKEYREKMGLKQITMAASIGINYKTYNAYERADSVPSPEHLWKILMFLLKQ